MTALQLLRIVGRRWYVIVAGALLCALAFWYLDRSTGPVYSADTEVVFSAPGRGGLTANANGVMDGLVGFASAVQRDVLHGAPSPALVTDKATLHGTGVSKGYSITLPNEGGQWQLSYNSPALAVSVVGPTAEWVKATSERLVSTIETTAVERQKASGVASYAMITTGRVPENISVVYVGGTKGTDIRALVAISAVGLSISGTAAVLLDRRLERRTTVRGGRRLPDRKPTDPIRHTDPREVTA